MTFLIICGGSATDLPVQTPKYAQWFNVVDSFDTHARIPEHFENVDKAAKESGHVGIISVGWDPGIKRKTRIPAYRDDSHMAAFFCRFIHIFEMLPRSLACVSKLFHNIEPLCIFRCLCCGNLSALPPQIIRTSISSFIFSASSTWQTLAASL